MLQVALKQQSQNNLWQELLSMKTVTHTVSHLSSIVASMTPTTNLQVASQQFAHLLVGICAFWSECATLQWVGVQQAVALF